MRGKGRKGKKKTYKSKQVKESDKRLIGKKRKLERNGEGKVQAELEENTKLSEEELGKKK